MVTSASLNKIKSLTLRLTPTLTSNPIKTQTQVLPLPGAREYTPRRPGDSGIHTLLSVKKLII